MSECVRTLQRLLAGSSVTDLFALRGDWCYTPVKTDRRRNRLIASSSSSSRSVLRLGTVRDLDTLLARPRRTDCQWVKRGFRPTQRTQRKERNEITSSLDRPITAASDDGVCRWHAAKLWQTHAIKYGIIEIKFDFHHKLHNKLKSVLKFGL